MILDFNLVKELANRDTDMAEHIMLLYNTVKETGAKTVVELGAGQSSYALAVATAENGGIFYSIDVDVDGAVLRGFAEGKDLLNGLPEYVKINGDSVVVGKTWNKSIDVLLIDTDHTYEQTRAELEVWPKFVKEGGKILMHDVVSIDVNNGVKKAMDEFLEKNKNYKVTCYSDTKRNGLAVLAKQ